MIDDSSNLNDKIKATLEKISALAVRTECNPRGPVEEFRWLSESGALEIVLPGKPLDFNGKNMASLLKLLKAVGKANLSVGRIFEGHINTLYLIHLYAEEAQREQYYKAVTEEGHLFGIWNTQDDNGINFHQNADSIEVKGAKTFCSGALLVDRALITGNFKNEHLDGWQIVILEMSKITDHQIDRESWRPIGMKASGSFRVDFSGYQLMAEDLLGQPGIYLNQPYFNGGAIRFAAVQLGGAERICEETIKYLRDLDRTGDSFQRVRISNMISALTAGQLMLAQAGTNYDEWLEKDEQSAQLIAYANMTRSSIEDFCLQIMEESNRCVGARGLMEPSPLGLFFRDLSFYLRQPAPDATRVNVGAFYLDNPLAIYG